MNHVFFGLVALSVLFAFLNGTPAEVGQGALDAAKGSVDLAIGLVGYLKRPRSLEELRVFLYDSQFPGIVSPYLDQRREKSNHPNVVCVRQAEMPQGIRSPIKLKSGYPEQVLA